jgi:hypothetical protein
VSSCLETEGSVLLLTSSGFSCSGMLVLELAAKDLIGKVVKAGLVQVWMVEKRDAKDVRVRLVENIVGIGGETAEAVLMYLTCMRPGFALRVAMMALPFDTRGEQSEPAPGSE